MSRDDFVQQVNDRCTAFLGAKYDQITAISAQAAPLVDALSSLTSGGKKLRGVLAWIGWRAAGGAADHRAARDLGAALELFQAAALIHDDIIDRSATRRGQPSAHRRFQQLHLEHDFIGESEHFGLTGAILTGDLALSWASEAFADAEHAAPQATAEARARFGQMHTEVITGQYLDVHAEVAPPAADRRSALHRARTVLTYKSAKYSTEHPMALGCSLAGGGAELVSGLSAAALPIGVAFQLRDDLLGVFGDPALTGKPVGDDLREGKRTELIAHGLFGATVREARTLTAMLGREDLTDDDVGLARDILRASGAEAAVEAEIDALVQESAAACTQLAQQGVDAGVLADFEAVSQRLVARTW